MLKPLHDYGTIKRVVVSSYQSASGAGAAATMELMDQAKAWSKGEKLEVNAFAYQLLFNVIPHIDAFTENGYTKEVMKRFIETRKRRDLCYVGRIREDIAYDNGLSFFVSGDQLRKGAATNAVQIAELLIK